MKRLALLSLAFLACNSVNASRPSKAKQALDGERVPRVPRRLSAEQLRVSLEKATGELWTGRTVVLDPLSPAGYTVKEDGDLLAVYAHSLGKPDYNYVVKESREASVTFAKYAEDAARATCVKAASRKPSALESEPTADEASVKRNVAALVLRMWGEQVSTEDAAVSELVSVHQVGGWAAVCIDLTTDQKFLTY